MEEENGWLLGRASGAVEDGRVGEGEVVGGGLAGHVAFCK